METSALLNIRPACVENIKPLVEAAAEDNVHVIRATNVLEREGRIIGYLSIGNMPSVHMWFSKQHATKRDYLTAVSFYEGALAQQGVQDFWLPVESTSGLFPFVEKLGYAKSNFDNVFVKQLIKPNVSRK